MKKKDRVTQGQLIMGAGFVLLLGKAFHFIPAGVFVPEAVISVGGLMDLGARLWR